MTQRLPSIVILGGGTAGWITAALFAQRWAGQGMAITLVESPEIGIIGVGEGSTPQLKALFDHLGMDEAEWMPACDATYKLGIRFTGWSQRAGFNRYFHPFPSPVDLHSEPGFLVNAALARRGFSVPALPDPFYLAAYLADAGKGPLASEQFPFAPSYGYHFDSAKLGGVLRDVAVAKGARHLQRTVSAIEAGSDGNITALLCAGGERIEGDFFVDCSGFGGLIAQAKLATPFRSFAENLFNDRAVVLPTAALSAPLAQTDAVAMSAGWRWRIPLKARTGNGYVYASGHCSDDAAEQELRRALGMLDDPTPARFLRMKVGQIEKSWNANCLATGLAQGFIEPLEATALHIVIATALDFANAFEGGGFTPEHRNAFNRQVTARYEGIRDYIVAHYRMNQRQDNEYWRANAANQSLSDGLKAMINAWFTQGDLGAALDAAYAERYYSVGSWHCLFAGYGTFPPPEKMQALPPEAAGADMTAINALLRACAMNFAN